MDACDRVKKAWTSAFKLNIEFICDNICECERTNITQTGFVFATCITGVAGVLCVGQCTPYVYDSVQVHVRNNASVCTSVSQHEFTHVL